MVGRLPRRAGIGPFGYYGFLFGGAGAILILALATHPGAAKLAAAFACGAPVAQAIGRLRCLVQGRCHGKPFVRSPGIRVTHPQQSRVRALGGLHGVAIHPTQPYSIVSNPLMVPLGTGLVAAAFMSIDFPRSRRRFSRLTVGAPIADGAASAERLPDAQR